MNNEPGRYWLFLETRNGDYVNAGWTYRYEHAHGQGVQWNNAAKREGRLQARFIVRWYHDAYEAPGKLPKDTP